MLVDRSGNRLRKCYVMDTNSCRDRHMSIALNRPCAPATASLEDFTRAWPGMSNCTKAQVFDLLHIQVSKGCCGRYLKYMQSWLADLYNGSDHISDRINRKRPWDCEHHQEFQSLGIGENLTNCLC